MKIFKLQDDAKLTKQDRDEVAAILKKGGVAVVPTDTSYGLAAMVNHKKALARLFKMKGRVKEKTASMAVRGRSQALEYGVISCKPTALWKKFLPGPLTIVVASKKKNLPYVRRGDGTIAVRCVPTEVVHQLLRVLPAPVTITSANRAGKKDIYSLEDFSSMYKSGMLPDVFIDAGRLKKREPSTVVKAVKGQDIEILRPGPISKAQIFKALNLKC